MNASLYIHIPFCTGACDYCDFYSIAVNKHDERLNRYIEIVSQDVIHQIDAYAIDRIPSIYIGGGTPSILGAFGISQLIKAIKPAMEKNPIEISIEANPESLSKDLIAACKDSGINRISLGLQSFSEKSRQAVNRSGSVKAAQEALALLQCFWGSNFSVDLMTGLPYQNESILRSDIEQALSYQPAHVSLYSLILEEHTILEKNVRTKKVELPKDEEADSLWLLGKSLLEEQGFVQYEVSNFAKNNADYSAMCLHNIRYWKMENWLGAGSGASGTLFDDVNGTAVRRTFPADVDAYLSGNAEPEIEHISQHDLIKEMILMGFRYREGSDAALMEKRFGKSIELLIPETLKQWRGRGLVYEDKAALTQEGLLFLNAFIRDAFTELD
jgi:oxygen-independent coproporphyrinogen-3 oxidase